MVDRRESWRERRLERGGRKRWEGGKVGERAEAVGRREGWRERRAEAVEDGRLAREEGEGREGWQERRAEVVGRKEG